MTDIEKINLIAGRIIDEYRKHPDLDWNLIAAKKLYSQWSDYYFKEANQWINVNESLPNENQYVLLYGLGNRMITALFTKGKFMCYELVSEMLEEAGNITHWMPLPNKP